MLVLEEINSSKYLNLIEDIFINHSFLGKKLKSNIYIIAIYTTSFSLVNSKESYKEINSNKQYLLPSNLIDYSFCFFLNEGEEKKICYRFLKNFLNDKFFIINNEDNYYLIFECIASSFYESLKFIKNNEGYVKVNLRDIGRIIIFLNIFFG